MLGLWSECCRQGCRTDIRLGIHPIESPLREHWPSPSLRVCGDGQRHKALVVAAIHQQIQAFHAQLGPADVGMPEGEREIEHRLHTAQVNDHLCADDAEVLPDVLDKREVSPQLVLQLLTSPERFEMMKPMQAIECSNTVNA